MREWLRQCRYKVEFAALALLAAVIPRLTRRFCVSLSEWLGSVAFAVDRRGRAVALANLEAAFGGHFSDSEKRRITRASYAAFIRNMLDLFWSPRLTPGNYERFIQVEGWEHVEAALRPKLGPVGVTFHFGNFEWGSLAWGFKGQCSTIVTENFKNPRLTAIFNRLRGVAGHHVIPQELSMLRLLKNLRRGRSSGMLGDLTLPLDQPAAILDVLGGLKMRTPLLHAALAHRTGAALLPFLTRPRPDGSCVLTIYPPIEYPAGSTMIEIAQRTWDFFEPHLRREPELWMWPYKHWRYKPRDTSRPYPFYANFSKQFDSELADQSP